jgi:hypothetical protein
MEVIISLTPTISKVSQRIFKLRRFSFKHLFRGLFRISGAQTQRPVRKCHMADVLHSDMFSLTIGCELTQ